eukprot:TRINITY_DN3605_c0_g3_i3.p2 TRINITY_DN3605_c0_g3~~TRINITY_DN3605_c0_g3_i3.p2  ORF type:complete len:204 (+),score=-15.25 TRINITY_DN3605_c0_g3_i3:771-1382(+)
MSNHIQQVYINIVHMQNKTITKYQNNFILILNKQNNIIMRTIFLTMLFPHNALKQNNNNNNTMQQYFLVVNNTVSQLFVVSSQYACKITKYINQLNNDEMPQIDYRQIYIRILYILISCITEKNQQRECNFQPIINKIYNLVKSNNIFEKQVQKRQNFSYISMNIQICINICMYIHTNMTFKKITITVKMIIFQLFLIQIYFQ